ncbi:MAG: VIT1/CCC1 transporter family protein [Acidimicrobiia bacterium]|nr:VIT1/CCC1 transporter family protein [Acidimicrobiia bacterium]
MPTPSFEDLPLEAISRAAHYNHHHRSLGTGAARAAVFGASDGLVSNVALIMGVAAADPAPGMVRLAGIAGLVAGAVSMAAGEYTSMKAQAELFERELRVESQAQRDNPGLETLELVKIYESRGMPAASAQELAEAVMSDPKVALEVHAREELGIDPSELGSPVAAAAWSFGSFALGAILPLIPWFIGGGDGALMASIVFGLLGAAGIGVLVGHFSGRSIPFVAARQALIATVAALVTYGIGTLVGTGI